jgi:hypothetical protein
VRVELASIVSFRELHGVGMANKSDLFFVCACRALSTDIVIQESEIAAAKVRLRRPAGVGRCVFSARVTFRAPVSDRSGCRWTSTSPWGI